MEKKHTEFIAEVSSNHGQDLRRCFDFIDKASEIGCDAVKFQLFRLEELFAPEILSKSETHRNRKAWELPVSFIPELSRRCREKGIKFGCTPFYRDGVRELCDHVDFYKIASYELLWSELLEDCAKTGKPVILSTGMATMDEVVSAAGVLLDSGCSDLTLLHCVSGYPAPASECNLSALGSMEQEFADSKLNIRFGWSDHSVNPGVIHRAIHRWGAEVIEFHLDMDGEGEEYKAGHCWLPHQIRAVVEDVRMGASADGNGIKAPVPSEMPDRVWRADPSDGLRPFKNIRDEFHG